MIGFLAGPLKIYLAPSPFGVRPRSDATAFVRRSLGALAQLGPAGLAWFQNELRHLLRGGRETLMMGRQNPEMTVQGAKVMCFTIVNFRNQCPYNTESQLMGSGTPSSEDVF